MTPATKRSKRKKTSQPKPIDDGQVDSFRKRRVPQNDEKTGNTTADAHRRCPSRFRQEVTPSQIEAKGRKNHTGRPTTMSTSILSGSDACHKTKNKETSQPMPIDDGHVGSVRKRRLSQKRRKRRKHHSRCPSAMAKSILSGSDACRKTKTRKETSQPSPIDDGHVDSVRM